MKQWTQEEREKAAVKIDELLDSEAIETHGHHGYNPRILDLQCELTEALYLIVSLKLLEADAQVSHYLWHKREAWLERNGGTK